VIINSIDGESDGESNGESDSKSDSESDDESDGGFEDILGRRLIISATIDSVGVRPGHLNIS
jgi:hypothetical protein